jgi:DnaJ-class molecular chaperone
MDIPNGRKADIKSKLLQIATSGSFASAGLASDLVYLLSGDHVKCPDCDGLGTVPSTGSSDSRSATSVSAPDRPICPRCCGKGYISKAENDKCLPKAS